MFFLTNGIFVQNYQKSSVTPEDICTKPCLGTIISQSNKWRTGFRLYPPSDSQHHQIMK